MIERSEEVGRRGTDGGQKEERTDKLVGWGIRTSKAVSRGQRGWGDSRMVTGFDM